MTLIIHNWLLFELFANICYQPIVFLKNDDVNFCIFFPKIRNSEFCWNHDLIMKLIFIKNLFLKFLSNRDKKRLSSKLYHAVLEKCILKFFRGSFYDDVIFRDDSYLWSRYDQIKGKDLRLTLVTFWNLLVVKWSPEKYSNQNGLALPTAWALDNLLKSEVQKNFIFRPLNRK